MWKQHNWTRVKKTCPRCWKRGPVDPDFGYREVLGRQRAQLWCVACRMKVNFRDILRTLFKRR